MNEDLTFEEWFDIFTDNVRQLGYDGFIDKYSFESDYENGMMPEESAQDFYTEIK